MAFTPETKNPGDLIKSADWNEAMTEIVRLEGKPADKSGKVNRNGSEIMSGPLTIEGNVGIGTSDIGGGKLSISAPAQHLQLRREASVTTGGKLLFLELLQYDTSPFHVPEVYPSIRFHHENRFWDRIEGRPDGIHFKVGDLAVDTYIKIFAGDAAFSGNVGIGTTSPVRRLHVHSDEDDWYKAAEIHTSGKTAGFSFTDREEGRYGDNGNPGERWVWYSTGKHANLWTPGNNNLLTIAPTGNVGIGTMQPSQKLEIGLGHLNFTTLGPPAKPTVEEAGPGNISGMYTYSYSITFITPTGETQGSDIESIFIVEDRQIKITNIATGPDGIVIGRKIYRSYSYVDFSSGDAYTSPFWLVDTIYDNTTTIYIDNKLDSELSNIYIPSINTTGGRICLNGVCNIQLQPNSDVSLMGNSIVSGRITAQDITIRSGDKSGFVTDVFINRVGDAIEQGDVVVISNQKISHFYATNNNIPILEVDLTDKAYDARVCGIVSEVITEKKLPYVEGADEKQFEIQARAFLELHKTTKGKKKKPSEPKPTVHPLSKFIANSSKVAVLTKVEDQQMGSMVTLGAYAHCKVDAGIAPIEIGDLLTTSPTKGHAQKVTDPEKAVGAIIGKALGSLKKGKGKIPVLVMLQ